MIKIKLWIKKIIKRIVIINVNNYQNVDHVEFIDCETHYKIKLNINKAIKKGLFAKSLRAFKCQ